MFTGVKNVQDHSYLQVAESYRERGKVRRRAICTLSRTEELQSRGQVEGIIRSLSRFTEKLEVTAEYEAGNLRAGRVQRI